MSVYKCTSVQVCVCMFVDLPQPHSLFLTFSERLYCSLHIPVEIKDLLCGRLERCYGSPVSICVCIWVLDGDNYPAILDKGKYFIHHFTRLTFFGFVLSWFPCDLTLWCFVFSIKSEQIACRSFSRFLSLTLSLSRSFRSFQQTVYINVCAFRFSVANSHDWIFRFSWCFCITFNLFFFFWEKMQLPKKLKIFSINCVRIYFSNDETKIWFKVCWNSR